MFLFPYEILNAPREKTTFLWNFSHLFPELFYEWNTSINDRFRFFGGFFLGIISWKVALLFIWEGFAFQLSRASILKGGVAHLGHWFWWEERFLKNIIWWRVQSPAHYGKPWHTCTTSFKIINIDIMECSVVMECIYYVDACKIPALLCYIANKLFGQQ